MHFAWSSSNPSHPPVHSLLSFHLRINQFNSQPWLHSLLLQLKRRAPSFYSLVSGLVRSQKQETCKLANKFHSKLTSFCLKDKYADCWDRTEDETRKEFKWKVMMCHQSVFILQRFINDVEKFRLGDVSSKFPGLSKLSIWLARTLCDAVEECLNSQAT